MTQLFNDIYKGKKVFLTGHTGFKGSWLALWLKNLGAEVCGYSLDLPYSPNHFDLLKLDMNSVIADIRNAEKLEKEISNFKPDVIFHLAAQPLVRYAYANPVETYQTNVMGVVNLLEAARKCKSLAALVNVTTDKCYENKEWLWGYRENEAMGGHDPYSSSKGCSELITSSYRNSFFNLNEYGKSHECLIASARAGNVIGGGDWAEDRLVPDIIKAIEKNETVTIRSPRSTRPWQHVLEPLSGYLTLGQKLLEGKKEFAEAWNFGPEDSSIVDVEKVVISIKKHWDIFNYEINESGADLHEASLLKLDSTKANCRLGWSSCWDYDKAFEKTIHWYREFIEGEKIVSSLDLADYEKFFLEKTPRNE